MRTIAILVAAFLALSSAASADVIHLLGGATVEGKIVAETDAMVAVELAGGSTRGIQKTDISRIDRDSDGHAKPDRPIAKPERPKAPEPAPIEKLARAAVKSAIAKAGANQYAERWAVTAMPIKAANGEVGVSCTSHDVDPDTAPFIDKPVEEVIATALLPGSASDKCDRLRAIAGVICWVDADVVECTVSQDHGVSVKLKVRCGAPTFQDVTLTDPKMISLRMGDRVRLAVLVTLDFDGVAQFLRGQQGYGRGPTHSNLMQNPMLKVADGK